MNKGGYQMVSLGGKSLTSGSAVSIPGTWDAIEGNYHKPVLLTGIVISEVEIADIFVCFTGSGPYVATVPGLGTFSVADDDQVTFTAQ